jgi:hypothetical protein
VVSTILTGSGVLAVDMVGLDVSECGFAWASSCRDGYVEAGFSDIEIKGKEKQIQLIDTFEHVVLCIDVGRVATGQLLYGGVILRTDRELRCSLLYLLLTINPRDACL